MSESMLSLVQQWRDPLLLALQVVLILLTAFILQRLVVRGLGRLGQRYPLPPELLLPLRGGFRWLIIGGALN